MPVVSWIAVGLFAAPAPPADPALLDRVTRIEAPTGLPRPADPFSALRDVPGLVLDRVDIGGSETALQSPLVSRGDGGGGATWHLDGVDVTDPAAPGFSAVYVGTGPLAAVEATVSTVDVHHRTPGVHVNLALPAFADRRRGSALVRAGGAPFQWDNRSDALKTQGLQRTETRHILDVAAEAGQPVAGGRAELWGSVSYGRLAQASFTEHDDVLQVTNVVLKGRIRLGGGRLDLLALRGEKIETERDPAFSTAPAARWRQSGATWVLAVADERPLAPALTLRSSVAYVDGGFRLDAAGGPSANVFEDRSGVLQGSYYRFESDRRRLDARSELQASFRALGGDHRLVAGAGYRRLPVTTRSEWPGNKVLGIERDDVFFRTFRLTGFAVPMRDISVRSRSDEITLLVQDTLRRGRLLATAGIRADFLKGRALPASIAANPVFPTELPAVSFPGSDARFDWLDLLPRAGISWDLSGRLRAQATYAAYAGPLGSGDVTFDVPGRDFASVTYYWNDRDGDDSVDPGELDTLRGRIGASGVDPESPATATSPNRIDPGLRSPRTHEVATSLERGWAGGALSLTTYFRRGETPLWRPLQNLTRADYIVRGAAQGELFGEAYGVAFYAPASESRIAPGQGRVLTNREGYHQETIGVELTARVRVRGFEAGAWGSITDWRERFDDPALAVQDPTSTDGEPLRNGGTVAARSSGLGRDVFVNARWSAGAQLSTPRVLGFRLSSRAYARDGFPIPYVQVVGTGDPTAGSKAVLIAPRFDAYRLPSLVLLDARLERSLRTGKGRLLVALDGFNVLNAATPLQVARDVDLPAFPRAREIVRPRVLALVARYEF